METPEIISQRSLLSASEFRFDADHLEYRGVEWDFKAKYTEIGAPSQFRRSQTPDKAVRFVFIYLIVLALALLHRDSSPHIGQEGFYWLLKVGGGFIALITAVCGTLYYLTHRSFTIVPTRNGGVVVFKDKQHDLIIEKLQATRLRGLRLLSTPNPANSPAEELAKAKWLFDEGAVNEQEYLNLCAQAKGWS